jgi:hypothetical protein
VAVRHLVLLLLPACGEKVGMRGLSASRNRAVRAPHPATLSPQRAGRGRSAAALLPAGRAKGGRDARAPSACIPAERTHPPASACIIANQRLAPASHEPAAPSRSRAAIPPGPSDRNTAIPCYSLHGRSKSRVPTGSRARLGAGIAGRTGVGRRRDGPSKFRVPCLFPCNSGNRELPPVSSAPSHSSPARPRSARTCRRPARARRLRRRPVL